MGLRGLRVGVGVVGLRGLRAGVGVVSKAKISRIKASVQLLRGSYNSRVTNFW